MKPGQTSAYTLPQTEYRLEFVGTWPTNLAALLTSSSKWKLTSPDGTVHQMRTLGDPVNGKFLVGKVTQEIDPNGNVLEYSYGAYSELLHISDAQGRSISFTWFFDAAKNPTPRAITEARLPGGAKIRYLYDYASNGSVDIDATRLIGVEYVDPSNVVVDKTTYEYGDARFPRLVTSIKDKNGVLRWSVTYDDRARATSSSGPGGVEASTVSYSAPGATFTRTVTNALGKQEVYTFTRSSSSVYDQRLTGTTGVASTNCPATATSLTYDANRFIASTTDQEGRVTNYTRNARGLPTQTVEASGTSAARTTNTTWHTAMEAPTEIVAPGLTTTYAYQSVSAGGPPTYTVSQTFSYSGSAQTYTVPSGVTKATAELWGAAGGNGNYSAGAWSGAGGYLRATFAVTPGDVLKLEVGQGGRGAIKAGDGGAGGWPDGGSGSKGDATGGGGGGSTRLYINGVLKAVAGGGGGSGGYSGGGSAGAGGGPKGQAAASDGGTGGTQTAAGVDANDTGNANKSGRSIVAYPGVQRTGGWGGASGDATTSSSDDGGGGGGGYWGGGGGGGDGRSGGGGSSWADTSASLVQNLPGAVQTPAVPAPGGATLATGVNSGSNGPAVAGGDGYATVGLK